jgi:hypothetical protein
VDSEGYKRGCKVGREVCIEGDVRRSGV